MHVKRLKRTNVPSRKLSRLYFDLIWCHKIAYCVLLFKRADLESDDFFRVGSSLRYMGSLYLSYIGLRK